MTGDGARAPSFCRRHWDMLRAHQSSTAVAAVRALQLGLDKVARAEGWGPENPHEPSEAGPIVGPCWVCHFGVGFLNELDEFIAHPPEWARQKEESP